MSIWEDRGAQIRAIILDVDGVLTDGRLGYNGSERVKFFDVRDGHAIKLAQRTGLRVGILSGRADPPNRQRAEELGLGFVYEGEKNKREAFARLLAEQELGADEVVYIGDDVVDMPCVRQAGIGVAVADAVEELCAVADYVTARPGGRGAVREVIRALLIARGDWDGVMARYRD